MKRNIGIIFPILLIFGCSSSNIGDGGFENFQTIINQSNIESNLKFLASDELGGREAGTQSEKISALFLASELEKYGAKPHPQFGSFLVPFPLESREYLSNSSIKLTAGSEERVFKIFDSFVPVWTPQIKLENSSAVFVGYGITAKEFDYDDYKDIDVKDKIVFMISGEPKSDDDKFFAGEEDTRYSNFQSKIRTAQSLGAKAVVLASFEVDEDFFESWKERMKGPSIGRKSSGNQEQQTFGTFYLSRSAFLSMIGKDDTQSKNFEESLYKKEKLASFSLNGNLSINLERNATEINGYNVVAVIEGNDEKLKNEYVAIGAHFDHVGISGGKVFNGADDDGSGTVAVLDIARAFAQRKENKRSILIVFHGAEEKGLLGSSHFTDNFSEMNKIVSQINLDMVGREHIDTIFSVGSDKLSSELKTIVENVNKNSVNFVFNYMFDDPNDKQRIYYRSDHYNYAKRGIPIVFFYDYMLEDYHKHSDEVDKINFAKIKKTATICYLIAREVANKPERLLVDKKEN